MKIAIIGQDFEAKKKIVEKFMELCPNYGTPNESIYDEEVEIPHDVTINEEWSTLEKQLYKRMSFLATQMDKYYNKENIIYVGHSLDVLVETMTFNSIVQAGFFSQDEYVGDEFVEKMIYWNQKLMKKLDLIYWLPCAEKVFSSEENEEFQKNGSTPYEFVSDSEMGEEELTKLCQERQEKWESKWLDNQSEIIYNNIWNDYINNFDKSIILPRDCPGMGVFETESCGAELSDIVNDLECTNGKDTRLDDIAKLDKIIKDKRLLDGMKKALMEKTIPLPSGEIVSSGGIPLRGTM